MAKPKQSIEYLIGNNRGKSISSASRILNYTMSIYIPLL